MDRTGALQVVVLGRACCSRFLADALHNRLHDCVVSLASLRSTGSTIVENRITATATSCTCLPASELPASGHVVSSEDVIRVVSACAAAYSASIVRGVLRCSVELQLLITALRELEAYRCDCSGDCDDRTACCGAELAVNAGNASASGASLSALLPETQDVRWTAAACALFCAQALVCARPLLSSMPARWLAALSSCLVSSWQLFHCLLVAAFSTKRYQCRVRIPNASLS